MSSSSVALDLPEPREPQPFEFSGNRAPESLTLRLSASKEGTPIQEGKWCAWDRRLSRSIADTEDTSAAILDDYPTQDMAYTIYQARHYQECQRAIDELRETAKEPNWDGEDAEPVSDEALSVALKVAAKLPGYLPAPEIYPDPEGRIEFDWALDNGTSFTLTVGPKGDAAMSAQRTKGGFLRGWSKNDDDDDTLPDFVAFSLSWLEKMAVK